jgi:hypothetical protein
MPDPKPDPKIGAGKDTRKGGEPPPHRETRTGTTEKRTK